MSRILRRSGRILKAYTTTFPLDEYPIKEGGAWQVTNDPTASVVQTFGGSAYGTQRSGCPFGPYDDSWALLSGFGPNVEVEGIINKAGGPDTVNREVSIVFRGTTRAPRRST